MAADEHIHISVAACLELLEILNEKKKKKTPSIGSGFIPALLMKNTFHRRITCTARNKITGHLSKDQASVKETGRELMSVT